MLGPGTWEILLILLVVLLIFGPDRLPKVARSLTRFVNQLRDTVFEVKRQVGHEIDEVESTLSDPPENREK